LTFLRAVVNVGVIRLPYSSSLIVFVSHNSACHLQVCITSRDL